jgi:hypothetical protein
MDKEEERDPVQCCFDRVVSEVDPVADSVQRRARPHQRSFAPTPELQRALRTKEVATAASRRLKRVGLIAERVARLTALAGAPQVDPDLNVGWSAG